MATSSEIPLNLLPLRKSLFTSPCTEVEEPEPTSTNSGNGTLVILLM